MAPVEERRRRLLATYEVGPNGRRKTERAFVRWLGLSHLLLMGIAALAVLTVEPAPPARATDTRAARFTFRPEPERPVPPPPAPAPPAPEPAHEPIPELTPKTVLEAAIDRPTEEPEEVAAVAPDPEEAPPPRRVYGVRKVYARGLGAGEGGGAGLVVKRGNTVDGRPDSLTALPEDLEGTLAPLSTVSQAPVPTHRVKPRYSDALRENRATGTVSARLLVDVDGTVRAVEVISDIGFDSRELAVAAFRQFRFQPALRAGEPVAVWILHKIRFEFQE